MTACFLYLITPPCVVLFKLAPRCAGTGCVRLCPLPMCLQVSQEPMFSVHAHKLSVPACFSPVLSLPFLPFHYSAFPFLSLRGDPCFCSKSLTTAVFVYRYTSAAVAAGFAAQRASAGEAQGTIHPSPAQVSGNHEFTSLPLSSSLSCMAQQHELLALGASPIAATATWCREWLVARTCLLSSVFILMVVSVCIVLT